MIDPGLLLPVDLCPKCIFEGTGRLVHPYQIKDDFDSPDIIAFYRCGHCMMPWLNNWERYSVSMEAECPGCDDCAVLAATMAALWEPYGTPCPRCGYTETQDHGPYEYSPFDEALGGPPDHQLHYLSCGQCGKGFDAGPAELYRGYQ